MKADVPWLAGGKASVPGYLSETYWWAYVHPRAVRLFERQWLVNLILWGNFGRLPDATIEALAPMRGRTLQVACVYGDLTRRLCESMPAQAALDVVDVLPIQLDNLAKKLPREAKVGLYQGDSATLGFPDRSYDRALLFFLLHEQPDAVRRRTLAEVLRVVKPGGRVVIVDYHRPSRANPLYWPMVAILRTLEPFAMDLWRHEVREWFPAGARFSAFAKQTAFGGLYQVLTLTKG